MVRFGGLIMDEHIKDYYTLRGWTLEDHPIDDHIKKEVERWYKSLINADAVTAVDKDCPSY